MARVIVLGAGMVGRAMAIDLARSHEVVSADIDAGALETLRSVDGIAPLALDLTDRKRLAAAVADFDLVIGAAPGFLGFETLKTTIESGKNIVDISFCPENPLELDELARSRGVSAIVDMGVAPGMDHLILGHHDATMKVASFECLVGGLPRKRKWPFDYKAPFSPVDVIEEYTRPARYVENGHIVTKPALSDTEFVEFDEIGTLAAFNTDGLRTLLTTMPHIPNMKEKTLRYPGHVGLIQALKESGFFASRKIRVGDVEVAPREFTAKILIDEWTLGPEERELTIMRVTVAGEESGVEKVYVHHLFDEYDVQTRTSSMARTTGYACTAAAALVLGGDFRQPGVFAPEAVGRHRRCYDRILAYLAARGVVYRTTERTGTTPT